MTLQQFLLILRARAGVALLTLLVTIAAATAISLVMQKQYTASTAIVIDVKSPDPIAGLVLPGLISPGYMATQVDIITSDRVAQRVVNILKMDKNDTIREKWLEATEGKGDIVAWIASALQKKLDVKPSRESNVINIAFTGSDPTFAAAAADAFAHAYIDINLELKVEPARQNAVWFESQTKSLRDKLEAAQTALSAYQRKSGIVATEERLDYETAKLNELSSQLTLVQTQTTDSSSKNKSAGSSDTFAEVLQNPLINSLKADIARLEAKLQESNVNLGKNHPQTQRTETELASLKAKLGAETHKITSSITTTYNVGKQKEKELLEAIERQKNRVLALSQQRDEIAVLKRDVESAQRAFEGVSQRSALTRLESLSIQTNAVVLAAATEPLKPSRPKVILNILVSVFLGTFLGIGAALVLELVNRRVRSTADLEEVLELPVLAVIQSTALKRKKRRLPRKATAPITEPWPATTY